MIEFTDEEVNEMVLTLERVESHLRAVDQSNADANLAEIRERPLTRAVSELANVVNAKLDHEVD